MMPNQYFFDDMPKFSFGQGALQITSGAVVVSDAEKIFIIQALEDVTISAATPSIAGRWPDTAGFSGVTIPAGMAIYGRWDALTIGSGSAAVYTDVP